jgi:hypothetical protein
MYEEGSEEIAGFDSLRSGIHLVNFYLRPTSLSRKNRQSSRRAVRKGAALFLTTKSG